MSVIQKPTRFPTSSVPFHSHRTASRRPQITTFISRFTMNGKLWQDAVHMHLRCVGEFSKLGLSVPQRDQRALVRAKLW